MKRRILIAVFSAIFLLGIIGVLNRTPKADAGTIDIEIDGSSTVLEGTEIAVLRKGTLTENDVSFDIPQIAETAEAFDQKVQSNPGEETITQTTDMAVGYTGRLAGDISYTVYDTSGEIISSASSQLDLHTKDADSCIVQVNAKWGREKNYVEYVYFFRVNFIK